MKVWLGGYSDDCSNVSVTKHGETDRSRDEYCRKAVLIDTGNGVLTASIQYVDGDWEVTIECPDHMSAMIREQIP